jgi:hypothetical protein
MKTDDLIRLLAADTTVRRPVLPDVMWMALLPVLAVGAGFLGFAGIRADLGAVLVDPWTVWKWLLPVMIAGAGVTLAARMTRPEAQAGRRRLLLWLAACIALWLVGARLVAMPADQWAAAARGNSLVFCLISIFGIGFPGLIATLLVMRRGATTRPALGGLVAGLGCGGVATAVYALHCVEDDPLFFVTWYGGAICLLGLAGAFLGTRLLRW